MLKDILPQSYGELFIIHSSLFTFIKKNSVFLSLLNKNAPTHAPYKEKRIKYDYNICKEWRNIAIFACKTGDKSLVRWQYR